MWRRKFESRITFFSKPNKTYNYQYCKWWLYSISNQPQQSAVQNNLISATHFGDGTDLRRSPLRANKLLFFICFLSLLNLSLLAACLVQSHFLACTWRCKQSHRGGVPTEFTRKKLSTKILKSWGWLHLHFFLMTSFSVLSSSPLTGADWCWEWH